LSRKGGGQNKTVNNFKLLKDLTEDDAYLKADPADILRKAASDKFLSTINLNNFWQISLTPDCRKFTSFRTPWAPLNGVSWLKVLRMPLSLHND
jgi:hypothetical protein